MIYNEEDINKATSFVKTNIPPSIVDMIRVAFDPLTKQTIRQNYRDNLEAIRNLCDEAIKKFDQDLVKKTVQNPVKRKIRSAHAE